jgi:alanine-synthesizing transaminase
LLDAVNRSQFLQMGQTNGAMYGFVGVNAEVIPDFDDQQFALDLLEQKHLLIAPGVSFNVPYRNYFRVTTLPDAAMLKGVFSRIEELLAAQATTRRDAASARTTVVKAQGRFK